MIAYVKQLLIWYPGPLECAEPVVRYHLPLVKNDHWKSHGSLSKDSNMAYKNKQIFEKRNDLLRIFTERLHTIMPAGT